MSEQRRSQFADGFIYARFVEPMLRGLHGIVAREVSAAPRVLDAGCGPGALSLRLAETCGQVVGVDVEPRNIAYAERHRKRLGAENVRFQIADVSDLGEWDDGAFDAVTLVMVLHEMPTALRVPVLEELGRVGARVFVVDFAAPMPKNVAGLRNRTIELAAGWTHFRAFRDFTRRGGLDPLVERAGLFVEHRRLIDAGTTVLSVLRRKN